MTGAARPASAGLVPGAVVPPVRRDVVLMTWVAAATISAVGDGVFAIALAWATVHLLPPAQAGFVVGAAMIPAALLTIPGGVIADRLPTRAVMMAGEAARIVVLLAAATAWDRGMHAAWVLLAVQLVFGAVQGLSSPARATLVRQLVDARDLPTAAGWLQIGSRMSILASAPIGAWLAAGGDPVPALLVDAGTFAAVLLAIGLVVRPRFALPRTAGGPLDAARSGLSYVRRTPPVRTLVIGISGLNVFLGPVMSVGVALLVKSRGWAPSWLGTVELCFAAGAIAGSAVAITCRPSRRALAGFAALAVQGVAIAAAALPEPLILAGAMVPVGATAGLGSVWIGTTVQTVVDPAHLGRVSSVMQLGDLALIPLATPLLGWLAATTSPQAAITVFGVAMAFMCTRTAASRHIRVIRPDVDLLGGEDVAFSAVGTTSTAPRRGWGGARG